METFLFSDKTLNSNFWDKKALIVHSLISVKISRNAKFYTPEQRNFFLQALDLIDLLDEYLANSQKYKFIYFKTLKTLFKLLKKLNMDQLITTMIANKYGKNCIFLKFKIREERGWSMI